MYSFLFTKDNNENTKIFFVQNTVGIGLNRKKYIDFSGVISVYYFSMQSVKNINILITFRFWGGTSLAQKLPSFYFCPNFTK